MLKKICILALILVLTVAGGLLTIFNLHNPSAPDQQIFFNGTVLTMNDMQPTVEAVLVEGDRIVALGAQEDILAITSPTAVMHDLKGKTLMPGLVDAHSHFPGTGLTQVSADLNSPPIGNKQVLSQVFSALDKVVHNTAKGAWVLGIGFDETLIGEQRYPTRKELDTISSDHPIFVQHISAHSGVVNSVAMKLMGWTENSKDPAGGEFGRDEQGNLNGLIIEEPALRVMQLSTDFPLKDKIKIIQASVKDYLEKGVTTAQNGYTPLSLIPILRWGATLGIVPQRLVVWPDGKELDKILNGQVSAQKLNNKKFKVGAVKLVLDGSIQQFTGFLSQPYHKKTHGKGLDYKGDLNYQQAVFQQVFDQLHQAGFQVAVHANGDGAIDTFIDVFKKAQATDFRPDAKPIVVHTQMVRSDQLKTFAQLGIAATFFNSHVYYWGQRHEDIFMGPVRAARMSPLREALDYGVSTSLHQDSPVVPLDPWLAAWNAVTRETFDGKVLGVEQSITPMEALHAITIEPARQLMIDDTRGSIEVGKYADLNILQLNPLTSLQALKSPNVLQTFIGGVSQLE
jgi:predicted amidohydrolase YtcJ